MLKVMLVKERGVKYEEGISIHTPEDIVPFLRKVLANEAQEVFLVVILDVKNKFVDYCEISRGTLTSSVVHPREVFKPAILANAASVIVAHNHTSGDPLPSPDDRAITTKLKECGELLGVPLLDHIIVGGKEYHSIMRGGQNAQSLL